MTRYGSRKHWVASFTLVVLILTLGSQNLCGQPSGARLNRYFAVQEEKEPLNGVILVQRKGKTIFARAFGYASVEHDVKNSLRTKFPIASVSKPFIATAILLLEQKHLLSVNDRIRKHLPEVPNSWQDISVEHLLSHMSGIADYAASADYDTLKHFETDNKQLLQRIVRLPLKSKAGESYEYGNSNYVLLACIIERITGSPVDSFLQKAICKPLGLKNTFFPNSRIPIPGLSSGYLWQEKLLKADHLDFSNLSGSGGIISTAGDVATFLTSVMKSRILPRPVVEKMITPIREDYGYGWRNRPYHNSRLIGHSGRTDGACAEMWFEPKEDISVVYLSNVSNGSSRVIFNIFDILLNTSGSPTYKIYEEIPPLVTYQIPTSALEEYTGAYNFRDQILRITRREDKLYIKADTEDSTAEMRPYNRSKFWVGGPGNIIITFLRDTLHQTITKAEVLLNGTPMIAPKQ